MLIWITNISHSDNIGLYFDNKAVWLLSQWHSVWLWTFSWKNYRFSEMSNHSSVCFAVVLYEHPLPRSSSPTPVFKVFQCKMHKHRLWTGHVVELYWTLCVSVYLPRVGLEICHQLHHPLDNCTACRITSLSRSSGILMLSLAPHFVLICGNWCEFETWFGVYGITQADASFELLG